MLDPARVGAAVSSAAARRSAGCRGLAARGGLRRGTAVASSGAQGVGLLPSAPEAASGTSDRGAGTGATGGEVRRAFASASGSPATPAACVPADACWLAARRHVQLGATALSGAGSQKRRACRPIASGQRAVSLCAARPGRQRRYAPGEREKPVWSARPHSAAMRSPRADKSSVSAAHTITLRAGTGAQAPGHPKCAQSNQDDVRARTKATQPRRHAQPPACRTRRSVPKDRGALHWLCAWDRSATRGG